MNEQLEKCFAYGQVTEEGIIYDYELAGPNGADYYLFPADHHTVEDVRNSKNFIRRSFDALHIKVIPCQGDYPIPRYPEEWTPEQREEGFRQIVKQKQFGRVENCPAIDLFTANCVVQVLDTLNPKNRAKMLTYDARTMIQLTWSLIDRQEDE